LPVGYDRPCRNRKASSCWRARIRCIVASTRARTRSRNASCVASGTHTCVRSPDPYTFVDDLADDLAGENENEQRGAEEVLLSTIDGLTDDSLTGFAVRLALAGHRSIPREGEFDFLAEADQVFGPPPPSEDKKPKKAKKPTLVKTVTKPMQKVASKARKPPKKLAA
jgi:hypothetical protein